MDAAFRLRNFVSKKMINLGHKLSPTVSDLKWLIPDASDADRQMILTARNYSSTSPEALWAFLQALRYVDTRQLPGAIVECGVWKGGNLLLAAKMNAALGMGRQIWGYDTFEGMTEPCEADVKPGFAVDARKKFAKLHRGGVTDWCFVPIEEVQGMLQREFGANDIRLVKGKVQDTLPIPANVPERIAVLRLDTDFYESTKVELELLYPRLVPGGVLIIDDYGIWAGARKAVDEYFADKPKWLHYVNRGVRLMIKDSAS